VWKERRREREQREQEGGREGVREGGREERFRKQEDGWVDGWSNRDGWRGDADAVCARAKGWGGAQFAGERECEGAKERENE
jgi:hypothetical protein